MARTANSCFMTTSFCGRLAADDGAPLARFWQTLGAGIGGSAHAGAFIPDGQVVGDRLHAADAHHDALGLLALALGFHAAVERHVAAAVLDVDLVRVEARLADQRRLDYRSQGRVRQWLGLLALVRRFGDALLDRLRGGLRAVAS